MQTIFDDELTYKVLGIAMEIHRIVGFGFPNVVYNDALFFEFRRRGLNFKNIVSHSETNDDDYQSDTSGFVIENELLLSTRIGSELNGNDKRKLLKKLKTANIKNGLLINFAKSYLEWDRVRIK